MSIPWERITDPDDTPFTPFTAALAAEVAADRRIQRLLALDRRAEVEDRPRASAWLWREAVRANAVWRQARARQIALAQQAVR